MLVPRGQSLPAASFQRSSMFIESDIKPRVFCELRPDLLFLFFAYIVYLAREPVLARTDSALYYFTSVFFLILEEPPVCRSLSAFSLFETNKRDY